jgi:hypothetical protein
MAADYRPDLVEPRRRHPVTSSRRPFVGFALLLAFAAAGCGSTAATASPSYGHVPTATPPASESTEPTDTSGASPSTLTDGYATAEEAIAAWLGAQGLSYSGDCETGGQADGSYCSAKNSTVASGTIYISGPVRSEAAYWLLLRQMGGLWYVIDWAGFSDSGGPPSTWS